MYGLQTHMYNHDGCSRKDHTKAPPAPTNNRGIFFLRDDEASTGLLYVELSDCSQ